MRLIRIKRRGELRKWRRFTTYLFRCGVHHQREIWSCIPAKIGTTPYWYQRKMKRRRQRRMKRLERIWARYRKPKRLTEKQVKIQQKKEFIEELYRRIKRMAPYYRMRQKGVAIKTINTFEALKRRLAIKRGLLDAHVREQKLLVSQLLFIQTGSSLVGTSKKLLAIRSQMLLKMYGAKEFKEVLAQRKLINGKLTERRKFYMNILVPLAEYYHKIKNYDKVLVPKYFSHVEKVVYQERKLTPKKTQKQRFLQAFAISQIKYLELKEAAKKLGFYMQTRLFFTNKVNKIVRKLYYAKEVVVELMRDGHDIVTQMFHFYEVYAYMVRLQILIQSSLVRKRLRLRYRRRRLEIKVENLLHKNKMNVNEKGCPMCPERGKRIDVVAKKIIAGLILLPSKGMNIIERRSFTNSLQDLTASLWEGYKDIGDFTSAEGIFEHHTSLMRIMGVFVAQRKTWMERRNIYRNFIMLIHEISLRINRRCYHYYAVTDIMGPLVFILFIVGLKIVIFREIEVDLTIMYIYSFYKLIKRTKTYGSKKLGIFRRMFGGNEYECLRAEFIYFNYYLAHINHRLTKKQRRKVLLARRKQINERAIKKLKKIINVPVIRNKRLKTFRIYSNPVNTLCPLCCAAERQKTLYRVGLKKETTFFPSAIRRNALDSFYNSPSPKVIHDMMDCKQPAATFLIKIKILEDRRKLSYLGRRVWIDYM